MKPIYQQHAYSLIQRKTAACFRGGLTVAFLAFVLFTTSCDKEKEEKKPTNPFMASLEIDGKHWDVNITLSGLFTLPASSASLPELELVIVGQDSSWVSVYIPVDAKKGSFDMGTPHLDRSRPAAPAFFYFNPKLAPVASFPYYLAVEGTLNIDYLDKERIDGTLSGTFQIFNRNTITIKKGVFHLPRR